MRQKTPHRKSTPRVRIRADDDVGYARPPRAHRFKPGKSGNPNGRPKGVRNESTILQELLQHKVALNERGKIRKIDLHEAIFRRIIEDCLRGNIKSASFLLNRYAAVVTGETVQQDLGEDDKAVLDAYIRDLRQKPRDDGDPS